GAGRARAARTSRAPTAAQERPPGVVRPHRTLPARARGGRPADLYLRNDAVGRGGDLDRPVARDPGRAAARARAPRPAAPLSWLRLGAGRDLDLATRQRGRSQRVA